MGARFRLLPPAEVIAALLPWCSQLQSPGEPGVSGVSPWPEWHCPDSGFV